MATTRTARFDRTLRVVMWLDAFWSAVATLVAIGGTLAVTLLDVPDGQARVVGLAAIVAAVFLAACGAVTGVLLLARMNDGVYGMPPTLRLPLPRRMVPLVSDEQTQGALRGSGNDLHRAGRRDRGGRRPRRTGGDRRAR